MRSAVMATAAAEDTERLAEWLSAQRRLAVLTGAGVSTGSGIPDYRDHNGQWKRKPPVQFREFVRSLAVRRRYWARSVRGWRQFAAARPNAAHRALARLEQLGRIRQLITQNVDRLHQHAGSMRVLDLHGRLDRVECLACGISIARRDFQLKLETLNPVRSAKMVCIAPDGDADLEATDFSDFRIPDCEICGGILKPSVVFFGEAVPRLRSEQALAAIQTADALLVVGTSLMVWSGFRLARAARQRDIAVVCVNRGRTRADHLLTYKCEADCGALLSDVVQRLAA